MNNLLLAMLVSFLLPSCVGKHSPDASAVTVHEAATSISNNKSGDTLKIDLAASKVRWKGTKPYGTRKHEGDVQLRKAYLLTKGGEMIGGHFVVSMKTLRVTDIPAHENEPRRNLINHLRSTDFFDVEKYPDATFEITDVAYLTTDSLKIIGNLSIKDVTRSIEFSALNKGKTFSTKFTFDRFKWNITYKGNLAERTLVDRNVELSIDLEIK
ncbi:YceI family protein [Parapedobacter sp. DT-150]|uniref:YceI family protein n=1 Tax=Parapedobacter sp. DT-150 TaxID=3396162 RepID=UPI003F1E3CA8